MTTKKRSLATLATLLAATLGGTMAYAQGDQAQAPQTPAPQQAPVTGQGMMQGGGMMGKGGMMGQMDMAQMSKMMENCNRMMQSHVDRPNQGNPEQPSPGNRG